jgi:hypothetical protein
VSNGSTLEPQERLKVWAPLLLAAIGSTAKMLGDFFRELAVLVVLFVPLEFWKPQPGVDFNTVIWHVGEGTVGLMAAGMFLEYIAMTFFRIKRDLEGKDGRD